MSTPKRVDIDTDTVRGAQEKSLSERERSTLHERVETVSSIVRLPLPSDGKCNRTPMRKRWELDDSYLTPSDPRYASEADW
jgi:hypothetical protein